VNAFRYRISCGFLAAVARCLNLLPSSLSTIAALDILIAIFIGDAIAFIVNCVPPQPVLILFQLTSSAIVYKIFLLLFV